MSMRENYTIDIGIECHIQLKTKTKLFAGVLINQHDAAPNEHISPICLGMPGALPYLNRRAVELAIRTGLALDAEIAEVSKFDRKNYFYPDLPKGYQISQFDQPIVGKGSVEIIVDGEKKAVGITRAHLEEDAGKTTHPEGADYSLVDLNRAGSPLLEVVSEPDMHSAAEAKAFAIELYNIARYADVSDADLYHGNMRFDVNVSVRAKDSKKLGTRTETKNLNSFRSIERAVEYEVDRQIELMESGERIVQETRGWDDTKQKTFSQRSKEDAHDYRYFPEPDIPPLCITKEMIDEARSHLGLLPKQFRLEFAKADISDQATETLLLEKELANLMHDTLAQKTSNHKRISDWLTGEVLRIVQSEAFDWGAFQLKSTDLIQLDAMVEEKLLSSTAAKQVLGELIARDESAQSLAEELDLLQVSNDTEIETLIQQAVADNPQAAEDIRNGETKAVGFLVGAVMKLSQGKANPQKVQDLIKKELG